jgi:hypothetical protein
MVDRSMGAETMVSMPVVDGFTPGHISELFYQFGAVQFHDGLPNAWITNTHDLILQRFEQLLARVHTTLGGEFGLGKDAGYAEFVQRSPGRYDMACEWVPPFSGSATQVMLAEELGLRNFLNINVVYTRKLAQSITCLSLPAGEHHEYNTGKQEGRLCQCWGCPMSLSA